MTSIRDTKQRTSGIKTRRVLERYKQADEFVHCAMAHLLTSLLAFLLYLPLTFAAFGVTTSGNNLLVDSGAGLVTTSKLFRYLRTSGLVLSSCRSQQIKRRPNIFEIQRQGIARPKQVHTTQLWSWLGNRYLVRGKQYRCCDHSDEHHRL